MDTDPLILVTGADGFIGSHLVEALLERGLRVRALVQYNSFNSWGNLEELRNHPDLFSNGRIEVVAGDVRDPHFCRHLMKGVDAVMHLAALIGIPYSYVAPDSYIDTNVKGTLNICQAALEEGVGRVLVTSTSEVYGSAIYVPIDENHPRQPQSPYSASKISADAVAMSFYNSFSLPVTVVRPFNTYGPRQSARAFIPTVISQIASGQRQIMVGDLSPRRDFNYVADTARGFISILESDSTVGRELNIATGESVSMEETLKIIVEIMGGDVEIVTDPRRLRPAKSEVTRLEGDSSLLRSLTGWKPEVSLREGLSKTVDWIRRPENLSRYKPDLYNR